jgi:hypothetical protein
MQEGFTMRKSLFLVRVAVFLTALIIISGCKQVINSTTTTTEGRNSIYGSITAIGLQTAIDRAAAAGETVVFESGLSIGAGDVNLKNVRIVINGAVDNAALLNGAYASITRGNEKARITNTGTYIYPTGKPHDLVTGGTKIEFLPDGLSGMQSTATHVAIREFTLGPLADTDYSMGSAIDPKSYSTALMNIYVVDKLTVPANGQKPNSIGLTALGIVNVIESNAVVFTTGGIKLAATSTLTSSTSAVEITLPTPVNLGAVKVEMGKDITFKTTNAPATITLERLDGPGTLMFDAVPNTVNINRGNGTIEFIKPIGTASFNLKGNVGAIFDYPITMASFPAAADSSTGQIVFKGTVGFSTTPSVIRGDVVFNHNVTQGVGALSLLGNVNLQNGKKITFYPNHQVTLGADKSILVGAIPVLTAVDGNVVLNSIGMATLTAGAAAPDVNPTDQQLLDAKTLTLGGAPLTIISGNLQAASAGIFEIYETTPGPQIVLSTTAKGSVLSVAPGGTIVLANRNSSINLGVSTNDVTITGTGSAGGKTAATTLTASGGTVSLGDSVIKGSAVGVSLVLGSGSNSAVITSKNLVLDNITLDLSDSGALVLPMNAANPSTVSLKNQAKLLLMANGVPNANGFIKGGSFVTLTGGLSRALGATDANGAEVHSIAHEAGRNTVVLKGPVLAGNATISKTTTFFDMDGR